MPQTLHSFSFSFSAVDLLGAIVLLIWLYLVFGRGQFWWLRDFDDDIAPHDELRTWPHVVAIVPARNEAETVARTVESLARQNYAGEFSVIVVDDHSEDETAAVAMRAASESGAADRVRVHRAAELPDGWTGKLWALNEGVSRAAETDAAFYWFTDADVSHAPDTLRRLVSRAEKSKLNLTSLMVLLRAESDAEKLLMPAFLYFFLKLYPPRWIANAKARTAGAAGGCVLLRREALERIGGLAVIRGEVIDDCALARAVKRSGGKIWMGVTRASVSLRSYGNFPEIRDMIARTAFTQLRYSVWLLLGTLLGMLLTYVAPVALVFSPSMFATICAAIAWLLMTCSFIPTLWHFRRSRYWAPLLPLVALFYSYATWLSAVRYWRGHGGQWKGRSQAPHASKDVAG
ncbi:MAG TPA: glycosyltransferase [Candidatus Dormibacteraeota bacterium]|nr:glycosyltransferase [Candidatus Dormibacteraeota bacterium]